MTVDSKVENIIIVGGGAAGINVYNALYDTLDAETHKLILITPRTFYVHLIAALRMAVTSEGRLEDTILLPYPDHKFNHGNKRLIIASVTSIVDDINNRYVVLDNGEKLDYSLLVVAPGSSWEGPLNLSNTKEEIVKETEEWRTKFATAKDVILVGGGSIGIELAGELKDLKDAKNITIVHGQPLLLNNAYPDKWRRKATKNVTDRGIEVVLNDYVDSFEIQEGNITTRNGKSIKADLVIPTRGPRPNTKFVDSLGADVLTAAGYIKVNSSLQIEGHPTIFALGDVIEWKEQKQAAKVAGHAAVVSKNILALTGKGTTSKLAEYKSSAEMIFVTNGKYGGTGYLGILWGITVGNWIVSLLKSKDLLVGMVKGSLKF